MKAWTKYRLVLTGTDFVEMGCERTNRVIEAWAEESGVMNIKNQRIEAEADMCLDTLTYTACVLSGGWTGISSP